MDKFIDKIFKYKTFDKEKMLKFGFGEQNGQLIYKTNILDQFELILLFDKTLKSKLTDINTKDIYNLHLIEDVKGTFVGDIRYEYEKILNSVMKSCTNETFFKFDQSNKITRLIIEKYNANPEFLWEKVSHHGVFRNKKSNKWFGIILSVDFSKLDKTKKGEIEVLNIKLDKDEITSLLKSKGFYPAYHMNKKSWISILLNETLDDCAIMELVGKSYHLSF